MRYIYFYTVWEKAWLMGINDVEKYITTSWEWLWKMKSNSNFDLSNCVSDSFSSSFTSYWYLLQTIHNSLYKNVGCLFYKDFKIKNLTQCFYHAINSFMVKLMECKDIKSMITFWMVKTFNHNYHIRLFFHNT